MHYLLGLAALVLGAIIATRRTRPTWFVVLTCVLVAIGGLLAILSYTRVTDPMGLLANSILGWVFVGLSIITMLSAVFVLERRGEHGEELPPLIGDNPFDGDLDDSDDPVRGRGSEAAEAAVLGGAASAGAAGSVAAGSAGYAGLGAAGAEAYAADFADGPAREGAAPTDPDFDAWEAAGEPGPRAGSSTGAAAAGGAAASGAAGSTGAPIGDPSDLAMESALRASLGAGAGDPGAHTDERPAERADDRSAEPAADRPAERDSDRPGPSEAAEDGTTVIGADPDLATPPAETDVDAAPEGTDGDPTDDQLGTQRP